jgi:SAM-dependent methyltransferase
VRYCGFIDEGDDVAEETDPEVEAARAYESLHVEALFRQWARPVLEAAGAAAGDRVLDVACGTGVLAREALGRVEPTGSVTGLDLGAGMLAVAEEIESDVTWIEGEASRLPFEDDEFDVVVSQFGLMFFPDPIQAIREMLRCTKPGGRVAVAVWEALERSAAYPISVEILNRRAGADAAGALRAPFVLGDTDELHGMFTSAGASAVSIETHTGTARFPSVRTMVEADLRGWLPVMGVVLEDDLVDEILAEAETALSEFVTAEGEMVFDAPAHIVSVQL